MRMNHTQKLTICIALLTLLASCDDPGPGSCPYTNDGTCDEGKFTYCPIGSDTADCTESSQPLDQPEAPGEPGLPAGPDSCPVSEEGAASDLKPGIEWRIVRQAPLGGHAAFFGVAWGEDRFVAVGFDKSVDTRIDRTIFHSSDGERWAPASDNSDELWWQKIRVGYAPPPSGVTWGRDRFVAVGDAGTILYSSDGDNWTTSNYTAEWLQKTPRPQRANLTSVAWGGDRFVAVGRAGTILYSSDGDNWTPVTLDEAHYLSSVAWSGDRFVAVGIHGTILHSRDGDRWTEASDSESGYFSTLSGEAGAGFFSVTWGRDRFVAVGYQHVTGPTGVLLIAYSSDGDRWTEASYSHADFQRHHSLNSVTWTGDRFVAVGIHGTILYSSDGNCWNEASASWTEEAIDRGISGDYTDPWLYGVAWNGTRFVAVGVNGTIVVSP